MTDVRMPLPTVQPPTTPGTGAEQQRPVRTVTVHPAEVETADAASHRGEAFDYDTTTDGNLTGALFFALVAGLATVIAVLTPVDLVRLIAYGIAGVFCLVAFRVLRGGTRGGAR